MNQQQLRRFPNHNKSSMLNTVQWIAKSFSELPNRSQCCGPATRRTGQCLSQFSISQFSKARQRQDCHTIGTCALLCSSADRDWPESTGHFLSLFLVRFLRLKGYSALAHRTAISPHNRLCVLFSSTATLQWLQWALHSLHGNLYGAESLQALRSGSMHQAAYLPLLPVLRQKTVWL